MLPFLRAGEFEPGCRLPSERDLAERFAVSRNTLREALTTLEAMRVIERRPQSGIYLRDAASEASLDTLVLEADYDLPMTADDVRELNEFRSIIELQAISLACDRRTAAQLEAIDAVLETTRLRLAAGCSVAEQDAAFHLAVFAAANNQFLLRAANSFYLASRRRRERYFADPDNGRRSFAQHCKLRDAIEKRDRLAARKLLGRHLGSVERYWMSTLRQPDSTERTAR